MNTDSSSLYAVHSDLFRQYCTSRAILHTDLQEFSYGANNRLYRSQLCGHNVVIKIGTNPRFRRLQTEFQVLQKLTRSKQMQPDYFIDESSGTELLVQPFKTGTHLSSLDENHLLALGKTIARYHYPVQSIHCLHHETEHTFIGTFLLPVNAQPCNAAYFEQFTLFLLQTEALLATQKPSTAASPPVLVHGDLIPRNILFTSQNRVSIIDWEGARMDTPEADLATCIKAFGLHGEEQNLLIQAYGHPIDPAILDIRLLLHYLQVVAWRLAIELPLNEDLATIERVENEITGELQYIENILRRLT